MLLTLMSNLDGMVYQCRNDADWTMEFVSEGCRRLTGYAPEDLLVNGSVSYEEITYPEDREHVREQIDAALAAHRRFFVEYRIVASDGTLKWVWERGIGIYDTDGNVSAIEGFIEDVTERKASDQALLQAERSFRSIFENAIEGIFQTTADGHYLNVNPALARIYGYDTPEELIRKIGDIAHQLYVDTSRREEFTRLMREQDAVTNFVSEIYRKNGERIWISENARAVREADGTLLFYEGTVEDVTASKANRDKLEFLANHDPVTSLPNRLLMNDRLRQMMLSAQRSHNVVAVAVIDLDHFKLINDTLGHNRGDQLLQTMAQRMRACLREGDTVARLGGDEFVLLLPGEKRGEALSQAVQRVLQAIALPWTCEGRDLSVSCSIGVAVFPRDGRDVQTLLKNADTAMYKAKELGRNNIQHYSSEMNDAIIERLELQNTLRRAVEERKFTLLYQPKLDLVTGQISGMEALLRIRDPDTGKLLPPQNFIRLAEESGLIIAIGEWVLWEACAFNKLLQDQGLPVLPVAINLSARQLGQHDLPRTVQQALEDTGLPAECLELELTESMLMQDPDRVIGILEQLEVLGTQLTIDDFGTGYSSLSYLTRLPVNSLKIDRSFIHDLGRDDNASTIVKAVISLGHNLGLKVVAEGVETLQQINFLRDNACDSMQGFLFSMPLTSDQFMELLTVETGNKNAAATLDKLLCGPDDAAA